LDATKNIVLFIQLADGDVSVMVELYNGMLASADGRLMDAVDAYERALVTDKHYHDVLANLARVSLGK
jgi:hypothetical protein